MVGTRQRKTVTRSKPVATPVGKAKRVEKIKFKQTITYANCFKCGENLSKWKPTNGFCCLPCSKKIVNADHDARKALQPVVWGLFVPADMEEPIQRVDLSQVNPFGTAVTCILYRSAEAFSAAHSPDEPVYTGKINDVSLNGTFPYNVRGSAIVKRLRVFHPNNLDVYGPVLISGPNELSLLPEEMNQMEKILE